MEVLESLKYCIFNQRAGAPIEEDLDPITVFVVAALLQFKEEGSRITFSNDRQVFIQEPSSYTLGICLLPAVRELKGQSHDDLGILYPAMDKIAKWQTLEEQKVYKDLSKWAIAGLNALKTPYEKKQLTLAVKAIEDIIDKIQVSTIEKVRDFPEAVVLQDKERKMAELWTKDDILRINSLFEQMTLKQGEVPINQDLLCRDEIKQVEFMLSQKLPKLQEIWK